LVFSETLLHLPDKFSSYANSIVPVVHDWDGLQNFLQHPQFRSHPLVLKLDTGMNRLGLAQDLWEAAIHLIKASGRKSVQHLMSHFATSYYPQKPGDMIERQMKSFQRAKDLFLSQLSVEETSMSNSGAIEQGLMVNESWVRPGLMLYGPGSFQTKTKMVSRFVTHVLKTMLVDRGTPIGYGVYVTPDKALVVYLPIGYGDGFFTQSSGHKIVIDGFEGKVFGRVNMDITAVLMPVEAQNKIKVGDRVLLWDEDPTPIVEWATHMQTHAYQALCGISSRIPRVYHVR
jgi:alanine racemase